MRPHPRGQQPAPAPAAQPHPAEQAYQAGGMDPCALRDLLNQVGPDGFSVLINVLNVLCGDTPARGQSTPQR